MFLFFSGTSTPKYTKEQVLDEKFALVGDYCKLCDSRVMGSHKEHMREHRRELTAWLSKRRKESAKKSVAALANARRERKLTAEHTNEPQEEE